MAKHGTADFLQLSIVWSSALHKVDVVGHTCNPSTQEADVRESGVLAVLGNSDSLAYRTYHLAKIPQDLKHRQLTMQS